MKIPGWTEVSDADVQKALSEGDLSYQRVRGKWYEQDIGFDILEKLLEESSIISSCDSTAWCRCGDELMAVEGKPFVFYCLGCDDYYELRKRGEVIEDGD